MNDHKIISLVGNPNVGKSTIFNKLTGMNQHTGNWPGKTVGVAKGKFESKDNSYELVDLPGTYSLLAHSVEEEIARNFICFNEVDCNIVVCDATCLERNLNLLLQTLEMSNKVIVCVNLMDEAEKKGIHIDLEKLSKLLGVPVISCVARKKKSVKNLVYMLDYNIKKKTNNSYYRIDYVQDVEVAISLFENDLKRFLPNQTKMNTRWLALKLLENDESLVAEIEKYLDIRFSEQNEFLENFAKAQLYLQENNISAEILQSRIVSSIILRAEDICNDVVKFTKENYNKTDRKIDKIVTSKIFGLPIMMIMLMIVFWLTITGANYPSGWLSNLFFDWQDKISEVFMSCGSPVWLHDSLVYGVYGVLAWVVSVMLPPMAIFFPIFSLLEDSGFLPRIAYNLDMPFKKCKACGKQALTMCMGFGCNAAGIVSARIIDSPREKLLAILTNNFVPCNGRFPTLIAIISMFFIVGTTSSIVSALILTLIIVFGVIVTFIVTKLLSNTVLKGETSSYTLELPSYRKPQLGKVLVRAFVDRTLSVLWRAMVVAAPTGLVIWMLANLKISDISLLSYCSDFLDPLARLIGLDGVILMGFILGFPANEIVMPIIIMAYLSNGTLVEMASIWEMKNLFVENGWTWITAVSTILFSLLHWPCSTTLLTIKKETQNKKWTFLSFIIPTVTAFVICFIFTSVARLFV